MSFSQASMEASQLTEATPTGNTKSCTETRQVSKYHHQSPGIETCQEENNLSIAMAPQFLCRDPSGVISPRIRHHRNAEASEEQQQKSPRRTEESGKHLPITTNKASPAFVRKNFSRLKNVRPDEMFTNHEGLPSLQSAYSSFLGVYPEYAKTMVIDRIREEEYPCLHESGHVSLDYSGYGLFSQFQQVYEKESASFGMSYTSSNLPSHALYGDPDPGTVEFDIKKRVYEFLNVQYTDYAMVLTSCRESAFKLLAECYHFDAKKRLLSIYDHQSDALKWMEEGAKRKGTEIVNAKFRWPSLQLCSRDLQKKILDKKKKKKGNGMGMFVFPLQSSVTGTKYPYQWMSEAQQNGWDTLLDASALGPKALSCLGLSVFCPDFIVTSFFKVYSTDPTGFGCLLIKRSAVQGLYSSSAARGVGMVKLIPVPIIRCDGTSNSKSSYETQEMEEDITTEQLPMHKGKESVSRVHYRTAASSHCISHEWDTDVYVSSRTSLDQINEETSSTNDIEQDRISSDEEVLSTVAVNTSSCLDNAGCKLKGQGSHVQYFSEISEDPMDIGIASVPLREHLGALKEDLYDLDEDVYTNDIFDADNNYDDATYLMTLRKEPKIVCKGLNHAETLGFTKTNMRVRCLINWLVSSMLKLHHPGSPATNHLVKIYGPKLSYDRGASIAFNIFDWRNDLIQPILVQRLADRNNISLGVSILQNMWYAKDNESPPDIETAEVLTVTLGFLSNFEDIYRFWVFLAKFLDADFVSKEVWRYRSLNQKTVFLGMQEDRKTSMYSNR